MNLGQLSFLGDAVFELMVREYLIGENVSKINDLQTLTLNYVTAKRQAYFAKVLVSSEFLNEKEVDILRRGRNFKTHKSPKNCDAVRSEERRVGKECRYQ